jgi:phage replication-related protein YjqB (UPF0714/DUF867 family)
VRKTSDRASVAIRAPPGRTIEEGIADAVSNNADARSYALVAAMPR